MSKPSLGRIDRPKLIRVDDTRLVATGALQEGQTLPLVIRPGADVLDVDLIKWAGRNRDLLEENLLRHGAILFRGFGLKRPEELEAFVRTVSGEPLEYRERSSPRNLVTGKVYTSTEHPANQPIFLHNENSYQNTWPMKIFFLCVTPTQVGGETPIADCRKVFQRIDPSIRARLNERGFRIVRNFGEGMGLSWQTVFGTDDPAKVDEYAARNRLQTEWKPAGGLRTIAVRPNPTAIHPKTGEKTWFNHGAFFHVTTLEPSIREALQSSLAEQDLPSNTYYGDGNPIDPEILDHLRDAYRAETIMFPWQEGDLLMLDNMLVAHGRSPYRGERKVVVAMSEPMNRENLREGGINS